MVYKSPFKDVVIPVVDIPSFVFESRDFSDNLQLPAFTDAESGVCLTFGQLKDRAARFAAGLKGIGFNKWDVVAAYSPNSIHYATVTYGTLWAGGTFSGANPTYTVDELVHQLKDSGASVLIVGLSHMDNGKAAALKAGIPLNRVFVLHSESAGGLLSFTTLIAAQPLSKVAFSRDELLNKPAFLCYSSGTTGLSKGVDTTHYNLIANVLQLKTVEDIGKAAKESWIGILPFFHMYALCISLHLAPFMGIHVTVMEKFDFELFLKAVEKFKLTTVHVVPPIVLALAKHPLVDKYNLKSIRRILSGAAPLGLGLCEEIRKRLNIPVAQGYGLTETSPATHMDPQDRVVDGSVGVVLPNIEARIVNIETGKDCGPNQEGELWIRGPNVMKGYHNNPKATTNCIDADGYFHTGDVAIVDLQNHFFIVDRLKELIKYKGFQVPPAELEAKLLTHPSISDAAVISRPDESAGDLPLAYVVLKPGKQITEKDIQSFIAERVAPHKQLRGGVVFVDTIPKSASGKILRRILRQQDAERLKAKL